MKIVDSAVAAGAALAKSACRLSIEKKNQSSIIYNQSDAEHI
jgi:hypothetical protein